MQVADAVIFSTDADLTKLLVEIMKMKKVTNIVQSKTGKTALDGATRFAKGLLIIDWNVGEKEAVKVLAGQAKVPDAAERSIMLIAEDVSEDMIAIAAEYGVGQIYSDQPERKALSSRIANLLIASSQSAPFRKTMSKVKKLRKEGKWSETIDLLKELLQKNAKDWNVKSELANTLLELGHVDQAIQILGGVQNTKPPFLRGIHILGRAEMLAGNFDQAVDIMRTANAFNANDPDRLVDIGSALLELNKADEAEEYFDAAIDIEPEMRPALVGKTKCLLIQENVNDALALMRGSTSKRELASIFNTSAVMTMRAGNHESGMKLYLAAIKALGQNKQIHAKLLFNMGIGYRRWKQPEKALQAFKKSLGLDPEYGKAKEQLEIVTAADSASAAPAGAGEKLDAPAETIDAQPALTGGTGLLDFDSDFNDIDLDDDDLEEGIEYT